MRLNCIKWLFGQDRAVACGGRVVGGGKVKGAWGRIISSHDVENGSIELGSGRCYSPRGAVRELAQPSQATSPKQKSSRSAGKGGGANYSCKGPT